MTFSPIFFANMVFSLTFREQPAHEYLFGWNLIGATLGGVLEYCSMALGYNALAAVVGVLYAAVLVLLLAGRGAAVLKRGGVISPGSPRPEASARAGP